MLCRKCGEGEVPNYRAKKYDWLCNRCKNERGKPDCEKNAKGRHGIIVDHYGRQCVYCGSTEHLQIDHKNGDGRAERAAGLKDRALYRFIIESGFPDCYQVLCKRCNLKKGAMTDGKFKQWITLVYGRVIDGARGSVCN